MLSLVQNSKVKIPQMGSPRGPSNNFASSAQNPQLASQQQLKRNQQIDRIPSFTSSVTAGQKADGTTQ